MRLASTMLLLTIVSTAAPALAQQPSPMSPTSRTASANWENSQQRQREIEGGTIRAASPVAPTPEMWLYEQNRRENQDPQTLIRQRAQFVANQRSARLASQRWFGFSNARPQAGVDPTNGVYSPRWTGNSLMPTEWSGMSGGSVVVVQQP